MKSKFPGMDPFLEGADWQDVHNSLAYVIIRQIEPQLRPYYFARLEKYVVMDQPPNSELHIVYPDFEIWKKKTDTLKEPTEETETEPALTPPTATFPFLNTIELNVPVIEIRDKANNELITTIEIISPANKREPGYSKLVEKQRKLHSRGVHLLEIDLIRRGQRQCKHPVAQSAHYLVTLLRGNIDEINIWAIDVKDELPVLPIPLKQNDATAILDLQRAFDSMYQERLYADSVDYEKELPPPGFSTEDKKWIKSKLEKNNEK